MGNCKVKQNDIRGGLKAYQDALRIDPLHTLTMRNRGITLLQTGQFDDAKCQFKVILENDRSDALSWYALAEIYAHSDKKELALQYLTEAIKRNSSFRDDFKKNKAFEKYWNDEDFKKL